MKLILKDGSVKEYDQAPTLFAVAEDLSAGLARNACAAAMNGETADLRTVAEEGAEVDILTFEDAEGKHAFWHTASHILAQAVKRLWPETKLAIGPAIADGYYYDFDRTTPFTEEELAAIEAEMKKIVKENLVISRFTLPREEALALMRTQDEPYKVELIEDLPEDALISFYQQGDFVDLCAGPHLMSTKPVRALKLTALAGAYWRGNEKNKMLTRIYGTAYPKRAELDAHLERLEEAKKRDHRKIGREMKLFLFSEDGPGFPFYLPQGKILYNNLMNYWREVHARNGYQEIASPVMLSRRLWEVSGHWDHYRENMYTTTIDEEDFAIKPMNCPGSLLVYKSEPHSYRDLPLRLGEMGLVHRHEKSGALHGLMRVRCFTQDDAHIYLTPEQMTDEIKAVVRLIDEVYTTFGFKYHVELSTRPEDSMGTEEEWNRAIAALRQALEELSLDYRINEGDGAFYGPKIDFHLEDAIGRTWQCGTIQLDFQLPQRFEIEYIGSDGEKHRPIMIHRVVYGSMERIIAVLTEHFAGKFPLWMAPEQVRVLPISSERHLGYAKTVEAALAQAGIRASVDRRNEKVGYKVREAQVDRVPYMLVVGDQEEQSGQVNVRRRDSSATTTLGTAEFIERIQVEIAEKRLQSAFEV